MATTKPRTEKKTSNGTNHRAEALSGLSNDFDSLQQNIRQLIGSLGEDAATGVANAATSAGETLQDAEASLETWSGARAESLRGAIRTQPFAAIALSVGAGALLGTMLRR